MPEKFDFSKIEGQQKFGNLPEDEKEKIIDEAESDAILMQEKIKSREAKDYNEAEKMIEAEKGLKESEAPEIIDKLKRFIGYLEEARGVFQLYKKRGWKIDNDRREIIFDFKRDVKVLVYYLKSIGKLPKEFENLKIDSEIDPMTIEEERIAEYQKKMEELEKINIDDKLILPKIESEEDLHEINKIKNKTVDLLNFIGLEHLTSLPNIQSIFKNGFRLGADQSSGRKYVWAEGHRLLHKGWGSDYGNSGFFTWAHKKTDINKKYYKVGWEGYGNVGFLFDFDKAKDIKTEHHKLDENSEGSFIITKKENTKFLDRAVIGMIVTGDTANLERLRGKYMKLDYEQAIKILTNRLTRLFENRDRIKTKINLVPVYDMFGNMIWPEKMVYEEVKKFVAERDKKKEENKTNLDSGSSPE